MGTQSAIIAGTVSARHTVGIQHIGSGRLLDLHTYKLMFFLALVQIYTHIHVHTYISWEIVSVLLGQSLHVL